MRITIVFSLILFLFSSAYAQPAPDFTVTDVYGNTHRLYDDYLNEGKTVMIEIFFTTCPPCISIADNVEDLYQDWGAGQEDVEFFKMTNKNFDNDQRVLDFDNTHGVTFPGISVDGGALDAIVPYTNGTYGTFFGTPTFIVIAPDGTVNFDISFSGLDDAIAATGAGGAPPIPPAQIDINITSAAGHNLVLADVASVWLKSKANPAISYNLSNFVNDISSFEFPIETLGTISDPYLDFVSTAEPGNELTAVDLSILQKHVLGLDVITDPMKLAAADTNSSGSTSALDLITLVKVILGFDQFFPNAPTHIFYANDCSNCEVNEYLINVNAGDEVQLNITATAVGDLSY